MHTGELLGDELEAEDMKQIELAMELGITKNVMSKIINGKHSLTPELAVRLEDGFGIKAEFWMNIWFLMELT